MKVQDIVFFAVFAFLVLKRNPSFAVVAGLTSLAISIPLFAFWIFFTAERLIYYAAGFFLLGIILSLIKDFYENRN